MTLTALLFEDVDCVSVNWLELRFFFTSFPIIRSQRSRKDGLIAEISVLETLCAVPLRVSEDYSPSKIVKLHARVLFAPPLCPLQ